MNEPLPQHPDIPRPPRLVEQLLMSISADTLLRNALLGDLAEDFAHHAAAEGLRAARRRYVSNAIRAVPFLLGDWARSLDLRAAALHLGAAILAFALMFGIELFLTAAWPFVYEVTGLRIQPGASSLATVLWYLLTFGYGIVGGYAAAALSRTAPLIGAGLLGVLWVTASFLVAISAGDFRMQVSIWDWSVIMAAPVSGGMLRVIWTARRTPDERRQLEPG